MTESKSTAAARECWHEAKRLADAVKLNNLPFGGLTYDQHLHLASVYAQLSVAAGQMILDPTIDEMLPRPTE